jgi:hypothetical protein
MTAPDSINGNAQRFCMWSGPFAMFLFLIGLLFAGFLPPPSPLKDAEEIASIFRGNTTGIRVGMVFVAFAGAFLCAWPAGLAVQLKRIEGRFSPMTYLLVASGALVPLEVIFPAFFWQVASFRVDSRSAESIQTLNDMAWLPICGLIETVFLEALAVAIALLTNSRGLPVFPRWTGYYCLFSAFAFLPASLCIFFKTGPFAWDGVLAWWFVVSMFGLWQLVMTVLALKAINVQEAELVLATSGIDGPTQITAEEVS